MRHQVQLEWRRTVIGSQASRLWEAADHHNVHHLDQVKHRLLKAEPEETQEGPSEARLDVVYEPNCLLLNNSINRQS